MKKNLILALASGALAASTAGLQADTLVYDNSTTKLNLTYGSAFEFGDEVSLSGTDRLLTSLIFEYFGRDFSGNEAVKLRLYANDGAFTGSVPDAQRPSTELYSTGWESIGETFGDGLTLAYDLSSANIVVPNTFTWTVEFQGIEAGEFAGLELYNPPTTGMSYDDFWEKDGSGNWVQRFSEFGTPMNFGVRVTAVPEPAVSTLLALGGFAGLIAFWRRKHSA
jgi:hypothetical protein